MKWNYILTESILIDSWRFCQANKSNKVAVCKACINKLGRELALERSVFTNTKICAKARLGKCKQFGEQYTEETRDEILYGSDKESQNIDTPSITIQLHLTLWHYELIRCIHKVVGNKFAII